MDSFYKNLVSSSELTNSVYHRVVPRVCLWNPESETLESVIQHKESGILLTTGVQNPSSTDKKSRVQYLQSWIQSVESRFQD